MQPVATRALPLVPAEPEVLAAEARYGPPDTWMRSTLQHHGSWAVGHVMLGFLGFLGFLKSKDRGDLWRGELDCVRALPGVVCSHRVSPGRLSTLPADGGEGLFLELCGDAGGDDSAVRCGVFHWPNPGCWSHFPSRDGPQPGELGERGWLDA